MQRPSADLHDIRPLHQANHASFERFPIIAGMKIGRLVFSWLLFAGSLGNGPTAIQTHSRIRSRALTRIDVAYLPTIRSELYQRHTYRDQFHHLVLSQSPLLHLAIATSF